MVKLYVEGGGHTNPLRTACRKGFTTFITKAGINRRPKIVACGSRQDAYDSYCTAIAKGEEAVLLVDSEAPIDAEHQSPADRPEEWRPWMHRKLRTGDGWHKPDTANDTDCHLMVLCMESWFLADRETLENFFGKGFRKNQLPPANKPVETITKDQIFDSLAKATKECTPKGQYGKGEHSFHLLERIRPDVVETASPWARRFLEVLKMRMDTT